AIPVDISGFVAVPELVSPAPGGPWDGQNLQVSYPAGGFPADISVYGVRWMAGGVREWCAERFAVPGAAVPPPDEPGDRLVRGGCWHFGSDHCHLTTRARLFEGRVSDLVGFRLLRELP
ncbi:MAG: SUMF1/EgtB/PvdO family nonheme iron enzyme, partial [Myxococcota bacterium]